MEVVDTKWSKLALATSISSPYFHSSTSMFRELRWDRKTRAYEQSLTSDWTNLDEDHSSTQPLENCWPPTWKHAMSTATNMWYTLHVITAEIMCNVQLLRQLCRKWPECMALPINARRWRYYLNHVDDITVTDTDDASETEEVKTQEVTEMKEQ